eukprot:1435880-Amphidinium_carterae.1
MQIFHNHDGNGAAKSTFCSDASDKPNTESDVETKYSSNTICTEGWSDDNLGGVKQQLLPAWSLDNFEAKTGQTMPQLLNCQ